MQCLLLSGHPQKWERHASWPQACMGPLLAHTRPAQELEKDIPPNRQIRNSPSSLGSSSGSWAAPPEPHAAAFRGQSLQLRVPHLHNMNSVSCCLVRMNLWWSNNRECAHMVQSSSLNYWRCRFMRASEGVLNGLAVSFYSLLHWGGEGQQTRAHKPNLLHCLFL